MMQQKHKGTACGGGPKKKGSRGCPFFVAKPPYFFAVRCANLLRNFSTRPPSESTLFCVPV